MMDQKLEALQDNLLEVEVSLNMDMIVDSSRNSVAA